MKVYLDDVRDIPRGWERTYTVADTIKFLKTGKVHELSLDHDLGATDPLHTGYDVLKWIEEQLHLIGDDWFCPKVIFLHTANPIGKERMQRALEAIERKRIQIKYENT